MSRKGKGRQKAKNIKRAKYSPVPEAVTSKKYGDYFQPAKEGTLLGMVRKTLGFHKSSTLICPQVKLKGTDNRAVKPQAFRVPDLPQAPESNPPFIQENFHSAPAVPFQAISKRKPDEEASASCKRIKISVGPGVSLDD